MNLQAAQMETIDPDLSIPYAKLARHIAAMYEICCLAPTNNPDGPGNPAIGLSVRDRRRVECHLQECLHMIGTLEKWMMTPVIIARPEQTAGASGDESYATDRGSVASAGPDCPEDYLHPEFVRWQRELSGR